MNTTVHDHADYWNLLASVRRENGLGHAGKVLGDWLDEHDAPIRAHIFRHGVPSVLGGHPGTEWGERHMHPHEWITLPDESTERFLIGHPAHIAGYPDRPYAELHHGPDTFELFQAGDQQGMRPHRWVVRLRSRVKPANQGGVTQTMLHAALPTPMLRALADAWDKANTPAGTGIVQRPWNHFDQAAGDQAYAEKAMQLARSTVEPVWRRRDTALWIDPNGKSHMLGQNQTHTQWLDQNRDKIPGLASVPETELVDHAFKSGWLRATLSGNAVLAHNDRVPSPNVAQLRALKDHALTTGADELHLMTGRGDRVVRLARMQAAPGGTIVNNTFQRGGQFIAKARQRIRDVAAKLVKLAREPKSADVSVKGLFGRTTSGAPLTLGELKKVEDTHKLPANKRLSRVVTQPEDAKGEDKPFNAGTPAVQRFLQSLSAHKIGSGALKKILADPKVKEGVKLTHLVSHLSADYASAEHPAEGGSWYGGQVSHLDRAIHKIAANGQDHPLWGSMDENGELKGKEHPADNHPGLVLLKAVIAATSGNQNPTDNLASALKAWNAGRAAGHPIINMPNYNHEALEDWVRKVQRLHGPKAQNAKAEAAIRNPGTDPHEKAAWYKKWVLPYEDELAGKGVVGWAAHQARINTKTGRAVWVEKNNKIVPVDKRSDTADAKIVGLPFTYDGSLRPKGWGMYGTQVAERLAPLKALFRYEQDKNPNGTEQEHMREVARWLVSEHTPEDFDKMSRVFKAYTGDLPHLKPHLIESKALFNKGWTDEKGATLPGMFILGPKFGSFAMNLHSNDPKTRVQWRRFLTADKWWTRNFFRYLGDMKESPAPKDRRWMKAAVNELCNRLGTTPADLQADLWYHEKNLYGMLGAGKRSAENQSYKEASDTLLGPSGSLRNVKLARGDDTELGFRERMAADPTDATTRAVYADWLEEHGEHDAAKKLRWWSKVLPHMPGAAASAGKPRGRGGLYLPDWARELVVSHFARTLAGIDPDHPHHAHDELAAVGLAPRRSDQLQNTAPWWSARLKEYQMAYARNQHIATAQHITKRLAIGSEIK